MFMPHLRVGLFRLEDVLSHAVATLWASITRTLVPIIVGAVVAWLVGLGLPLDPEFEDAITGVLTVGFAGVYYVAVRLLETYVTPKLGWLLGLAKAPDYEVPGE